MAKGKTNNPNGRPKGKPNKATTEIKTWIQKVIDDNRGQLEEDLKSLEPKDRWQIIEKLMAYTTPKMQSVEAKIELEKLDEAQLNQIAETMLNNLEK
jgi:uncharacterized protein (UPF0305 family)